MKYLFILPNELGLEQAGRIKGEKQKENILLYPLKILWRVLFKMSLFTFRSKTKTVQPKHCYANNGKQP